MCAQFLFIHSGGERPLCTDSRMPDVFNLGGQLHSPLIIGLIVSVAKSLVRYL